MKPFISGVLEEILSRDSEISSYTFVLPGKRAGSYLLHQLARLIRKPGFAPRVLSIQEFTEEVADLKAVDPVRVLFEFYKVYCSCTPRDKTENFEVFSSWAQTLLHDFNEIDRYLVDHGDFFGYLGNVQELGQWYRDSKRTPLIENYLEFWNRLPHYYKELSEALSEKGQAYQGMIYRKAVQRIPDYLEQSKGQFIMIGFNALNASEQLIFQQMLDNGRAEVFWDLEKAFLEDQDHDVAFFMRKYFREWSFYQQEAPKIISNHFGADKKMRMFGIPGNIGQAKYVGEILAAMSEEELKETAVVLGDEDLLLPVLNSLPPNVAELNITMGFPLKNAPVTSLFDHLLKMHCRDDNNNWYYKDLTAVCNHPLILKATDGLARKLMKWIKAENLIFISWQEIRAFLAPASSQVLEFCLSDWGKDPLRAVRSMQNVLLQVRDRLDSERDKLTLEFLYQHHILLNQLEHLIDQYSYIKSIKSLYRLFREILVTKKVDFKGEPFSGLQIMGVLESRVLDFKNVIVTSVNEGVFPSGKSSNSFIPYDLKYYFDLPTYREKDAVYAYHFYHLLQRSERIHLLYNTESSGLNAGEKSRFLQQLEIEPQQNHEMKNFQISPRVPPVSKDPREVRKTPEILLKIKKLAANGFSPSALSTYIRNPLDFYKKYLLDIPQQEEVEETVAFNTLGSVVHDTLENFYRPWVGSVLDKDRLYSARQAAGKEVEAQFRKHYSRSPITRGKNLLILEVAKRYILNFLDYELRLVDQGNNIRLLQVEQRLREEFPVMELGFPVYLRGTVDRVDQINGTTRIIDYKTGKVEQNKVEIVQWEEIISDYDKYSKSFQVLLYTLLLDRSGSLEFPVEAGIISFKNMKGGFLRFAKKDKTGNGAKKDHVITKEVMEVYGAQLKSLILEICDPEVPFLEKEIKQR